MLAMNVLEETQLTDFVKSFELPSVKVPVAENSNVLPKERLAEAGVTVMDTNSAGVIVNVALFEVIPEKLAVMIVVPSALDVAAPLEPDVLLMVATPMSEEFQITSDVKSCLVLPVNVPVAVNCTVVPMGIVVLVGVVAIDTSKAGVTVSVADDEGTESIVAVIVVVPMSTAVARPFEPGVSLTVATAVVDVAQVANDVTSCMLQPPVNVPMAVNCCVIPLGIDVLVGDVTIDATADEESDAELKTLS